jgi:hypothetical protein
MTRAASIEQDGWALVSAEKQNTAYPKTFAIPDRRMRESLRPGDAAKLLFDIETRTQGRVVDRGVDRMWVIVRRHEDGGYLGVLDNDPGQAEGLSLHAGMEIHFGPEHIADIEQPPDGYVLEKYGADCFDDP